MARWNALWEGGANYGPSYAGEHTEVFDSLADAREELLRRRDWPHQASITRPDGTQESVATPVVDETSEMRLWQGDPDTYPETGVRLYFGPRGAVRQERF